MISRTELFKICRKIVCVGRNYTEHCSELNNTVPTKPLLFLKPPTSLLEEGNPIKTPFSCNNLHHEVELGIVIGKDGASISEEAAMEHVDGYVLALDMTARDHQEEEKAKGIPWFLGKSWDTFCPVSETIPKNNVDLGNTQIDLNVNGVQRQEGNTKDMIFKIPFLISHISKITKLERGDLILTGTPSGVAQVKKGDTIECSLNNTYKIKFDVE